MEEESSCRFYLCAGPRCTANQRDAVQKALEAALWDAELDQQVEVRASGCQGRCDFGPNATIWPGPWRYAGLTPSNIRQIVSQHLRAGQPLRELLFEREE
jgi:(2Fe-2S) ferredoxin